MNSTKVPNIRYVLDKYFAKPAAVANDEAPLTRDEQAMLRRAMAEVKPIDRRKVTAQDHVSVLDADRQASVNANRAYARASKVLKASR
jgi:hypothetical protein